MYTVCEDVSEHNFTLYLQYLKFNACLILNLKPSKFNNYTFYDIVFKRKNNKGRQRVISSLGDIW